MMFLPGDTIVAVASARGGAARGIVRISGPKALACLASCFETWDAKRADVSRPAVMRGLLRMAPPWPAVPCDVYVWPERRSYTGEPTVEIHTLGCPPLLDAVVAGFRADGLRLAQPGEFTMRAFLAGRLDLTQAEAVLGVIEASDGARLDAALEQLAGGLARPLAALREQLLVMLADIEAGLDFADEDIEFVSHDQILERLAAARTVVEKLLRRMETRGDTAERPRVVLIGRPNSGKSSLFNALTALASVDRRAIVSEEAGATRDYLTAEVTWDGFSCQLIDTAGLEVSSSMNHDGHVGDRLAPALAAQRAGQRQRQAADVELLCLDATRELDFWERQQPDTAAQRRVIVWTKCDMGGSHRTERNGIGLKPSVATSAVTGAGLPVLIERIREACRNRREPGDVVISTAVRCRDSLSRAATSLDAASHLAKGRGEVELIAAELRMAMDALGLVVGAVCTDDLLDRVFSRFCIGK